MYFQVKFFSQVHIWYFYQLFGHVVSSTMRLIMQQVELHLSISQMLYLALFLCILHHSNIQMIYDNLFWCAVFSLSVVSDSLQHHGLQPARLLCPWGFFRQKYQSELPCPPPGILPNPGIEAWFPALWVDSSPSESPRKPLLFLDILHTPMYRLYIVVP